MASCKEKLFQHQRLQRLKQRILPELSKVTNHFEILGKLLAKGVLSDGSNDSEGNSVLKEMMILHAVMIASSGGGGADAVSGLKKAMEESGNSGLFSALLTWAEEEFSIDLDLGGLGELQGPNSALDTPTVAQLEKRSKIPCELSSSGTKLIDNIMSSEEKDIIEQLESHLVDDASKFDNADEFCSSLAKQDVLRKQDNTLETGQNSQVNATEKAIRAACSMRAIKSLIIALQRTDNEHILKETYEWLKTLQKRNKNSQISVRSLPNHQNQSKPVSSAFFEQPAPLDDLEKVAVLNCQPDSATKGTFSVEFNKDRMLVYLADGTVYLQNWRDNEEKTVEFGAKVKNITCVQYDEEICVLGTSNGTVYLFDSKSLEPKWFVRLGEPVKSLKFLESKLVAVTRDRTQNCQDFVWFIDISRADMRLLKNCFACCGWKNKNDPGIFVNTDRVFVYYSDYVYVYDTESESKITYKKGHECVLKAPAVISSLNVVDLISITDVVLAGCAGGVIAMWNDYKSINQQSPSKTLEGHMAAIVSLCSLNGHVLSLDKSGKLLMWSGYELENKSQIPPVSHVLADDFYNVNCLIAHERWFAASSSEDNNVSIWTLPELWLLCG